MLLTKTENILMNLLRKVKNFSAGFNLFGKCMHTVRSASVKI